MNNVFRVSPRKAREYVLESIQAGLVPYLQSSPGMGKSALTHSISNEYKLHLIDHRLSTSAPEDLSGLPRFNSKGYAEFAPFADLFPLQDSEIPKNKTGWLLFLDELSSAGKSVQAAAYKLILDRMTGQHKLHENVAIVAAGNLMSDRAIVNNIGTAMQSRLIHIELEINAEEWVDDVAMKFGYDTRIIAFINQYPEKLMDFRADHKEKTFCCPRTWEFVHRLIQNKKDLQDDIVPLLAGTITSGIASEFVQYSRIFATLVSIDEVVKNPLTTPVPDDNNTKYALITHLISYIDQKNLGAVASYADRFDLSLRILFYRMVMAKSDAFRRHPAFVSGMSSVNRYLNAP